MKMLFALVIVSIACNGFTCNKQGPRYLSVHNKSDRPIHFLASELYPDTAIPDKINLTQVAPEGRSYFPFYVDEWSELFNRLPRDTVSLFIFSSDTVITYSWQDIQAGYKVLKRYDLSQQDIEGMSYTVTYP